MNKVQIVEADLKDLDEMLKWRKEVLEHVFEQEISDGLMKENQRYYQNALKEGSHQACYIYFDGEKAGCAGECFYEEMPSPDNPNGKCAYLMNIYVRKEYRKHGLATHMVDWLIEQARKRNVNKIYLEASDDGYPLYKNMGFKDMKNYLKLSNE